MQALLSCQLLVALRSLVKILTVVAAHFRDQQLKGQHMVGCRSLGDILAYWRYAKVCPDFGSGLGVREGCSELQEDQLPCTQFADAHGLHGLTSRYQILEKSLGMPGWWVQETLTLILSCKIP